MSEQRDSTKLGTLSGVYIPVFLNIMSILMFLRFGLILGQVGFMGIFGKSSSRSKFPPFEVDAAGLTTTCRAAHHCILH